MIKMNARKFSRQFLINEHFQISFLKQLSAFSVLLLLIQAGFILYFKHSFSQMLIQIGLTQTDMLVQFLDKQTFFLFWTSLSINSIFILVVMYVGLKLSQKIAGPIRRTMEYLQSDNDRPLSFRKGDYFHELADAINKNRNQK